jgi:hypothetical protein
MRANVVRIRAPHLFQIGLTVKKKRERKERKKTNKSKEER